jgi:hypothetical protein
MDPLGIFAAFAFAGSNFYPVIHLPFADSMKETL